MTSENKNNRLIVGCLLVAGFLMFLGCSGLVMVGMGVVEVEVEAALKENPVVVKHLGEVAGCDLSWARSIADDRFDYFHYNCRGTLSEGRLEVHSEATGVDGAEEIVDGVLVMPGGERYDIVPR